MYEKQGMSNTQINSDIVSLERKLKLMIHQYDQIKKENEALKNENAELKLVLNAKEEHLASFQNKYKMSKIVQNIVEEEQDATGLKQRIDEYIKEIDKCIAHLTA